jgi:DNA polymerase-1
MVTPDKDYGQLLIHDCVYIYKPGYQGGDFEILDAKKICEKWCIDNVTQVVDMLGLMGDSVDNIPGIKGIGEKTACKLIKEFGSLENIIDNADNIKGSVGEKIRNGKEDAIMSKKLAKIITTVPVRFHEEDFRLKEWNNAELIELFTDLEFKSMGKRILGEKFNAFQSAPVGVQADLFSKTPQTQLAEGSQTRLFDDNILTAAASKISSSNGEAEGLQGLQADKNITNTDHDYILIDTVEKIVQLLVS